MVASGFTTLHHLKMYGITSKRKFLRVQKHLHNYNTRKYNTHKVKRTQNIHSHVVKMCTPHL